VTKIAAPPAQVAVRAVWGTMIRVEIRDAIEDLALGDLPLDDVWAWFQRVDDLFSTWRDDSEISRLARGELALANAGPEVPAVLELCEQMKVTSLGAFDIGFAAATEAPDWPGRCAIDPTGLVKGWAVDRAGELLRAHGASNFSINAGGDVLVGSRSGDAVWRVGIQHPWQRDKTAAVVGLNTGAVATSGGYERGDHVFDPRTGLPARGLASVTVIASELTSADCYATAALALGREGMAWLATLPGVVAMGITDDQRVVKTAGFDALAVS
jgi:Membrane-associated lipoprotein involved in thiamine biosynthesis